MWSPSSRTQLEDELRRLTTLWFPRSIDEAHGGFLCDLDFKWRPAGAQCKMLEYQARQTLAAARAAARFPESRFLRDTAIHGFSQLRDRMWDRAHGGWYRMLDRQGAPLEGKTKHGHGYAYAISACVACHGLGGGPQHLSLAREAFQWLDEHAHDAEFGGYHVFYAQDGKPILSPEQAPNPGAARDPIGTPIGLKDANTTSDLLKALAELYVAWPDPALHSRLQELLCIVRDRLVVPPGAVHTFTHPDWRPLPEPMRYGQPIRTAVIILAAARALGESSGATARVAKSLVETALGSAWDRKHGGFYLAGTAFEPGYIEGSRFRLEKKVWWIQADGLSALALMAQLFPAEADRYPAFWLRQWAYIRECVIDARHGGWFAIGLDTDRAARKSPKATMWKDASHEIEALLSCLAILESR